MHLYNDRSERDDGVNVHLLQEVWGRHHGKQRNPLFTAMIHVLCGISAQDVKEKVVLKVVLMTCLIDAGRSCLLSEGVFLETKQQLEHGIK